MELILFVVFGSFMLLTLLADSGSRASANYEFKKLQSEKERDLKQWMSLVTDEKMELEFEDFIYDNVRPISRKKSDIGTVGWMSNDLKAELSDVPSEVLEGCRTRGDILLVMMAKRGKIPSYPAKKGIGCIGDGSTPGRRMFEKRLAFIRWLDSELQSHGIEPMIYKKDFEQVQKTNLVSEVEIGFYGTFCWWSGRAYVM